MENSKRDENDKAVDKEAINKLQYQKEGMRTHIVLPWFILK